VTTTALPLNLIDAIQAALRSAGMTDRLSVAGLRKAGQADLAVILPGTGDRREGAARAVTALKEHPGVAAVRRADRRILVRFDDAVVAELGRKLEEADREVLSNRDLHADQLYVVEFCNPNATKGLHIGHLRNIAIGHAFACSLEAAGARVERQCQISDAGRQSGEAMAGYMLFADGATPKSTGQKGDQFVGNLYARYVNEQGATSTEDVSQHDLAVAREITKRDDLATALLDRWLEGDPEVIELWRKILDWVMSGQRETLARLGVHFDRPLMESSFYPQLAALVESGVELGIFVYSKDGRLVYETGRDEYPVFPLARSDGFSIETLRSLTIWHELMSELSGTTIVHVCGIEWKEHTVCMREILERLKPGVPLQPTYDIAHGMVSTDFGVASSSEGNVILVDKLLDDMRGSSEVRELALQDRPGCEAEDLAMLIVLGFFLDFHTHKPVKATPAAMLDRRTSGGMLLARAWVAAWSPDADGGSEPAPDDVIYRFVVMQSQMYRQMLRLSLGQVDILPLVRFLVRFSEWYLDQPAGPSTARAMRSVLSQGLRSLGLVRSNA
jgi:arginyl-tRNA synthetase